MDVRRTQKLLELYERQPLWIALRKACDNPQAELRVETPFVNVGEAKDMDASLLGVSAFQPGSIAVTDRMSHFKCKKQKWRFLKVYDHRIVRRTLTPANQFVAWFVRYSIKQLRAVAYAAANDEECAEFFPAFLRIIRRLNAVWDELSPDFKHTPLDSIPIDSQFLQFDPQYHVILETYLACESL